MVTDSGLARIAAEWPDLAVPAGASRCAADLPGSVASLIQYLRQFAYFQAMNWKTVRLELAGTRDFPAGSVSRGYLVRIPLKDTGSIDEESFAETPKRATVRRFWSTEPDVNGRVVHADGHW